MRRFIFGMMMLLCALNLTKADNDTQITFIITKIPNYTPATDTIYMATSLNGWKIADKEFLFRPFPDGTFRLTLNMKKGEAMTFKVNRGDWNKAEGTEGGAYLENRKFVATDKAFEHRFEVKTWEDLHRVFFPPVKIKLVSLPKNTPEDCKIYIAGDFNGWRVKDPDYELHKLSDGTFEGVAGQGFSQFKYKFNRGSWATAEGRFDGGSISNHLYINSQKDGVIIATIESWEDLSTGAMWRKMIFILLLIEVIKVIAVAISFTRSPYPFFILAIIFLGFLLRFTYSSNSGFVFFQQGFLIPSVMYGFLGSLLYHWLESDYASSKLKWTDILPAIPLVFLVPLLFYSTEKYSEFLVDPKLNYYFTGFYLFSLSLNIFYGFKAIKLIQKMKKEIAEWKYLLFRGWVILNWISLGFCLLAGFLIMLEVDSVLIKDWLENFLWIGLGVLILLLESKALLYFINYAIKGKIKTYEPESIDESEGEEDSWTVLKPRLIYLMEEKAVFTNAKLSLADLAQTLGTNTNYVSRLLNEGLKTSFADYVNAYRIKYFIKILKEDKDQSKTFLFHAYNSGFNSKSAFNRAFKKYTGKTPSEYFVNLDVPDLEGN